jgi:hypothetical protein
MNEPRVEAALDREIQQLLAVEHSPEFLARVRTAVALESPRRGWLFTRPLAAAVGGLGAVALAALIIGWPAPVPTPRAVSAPRVQRPGTTRLAPPPEQRAEATGRLETPPTSVSASRRVRRASVPPPVVASRDPFADVLISAEETHALNALVASVRGGRMPAVAPSDPAVSGPLAIPMELQISTLVITPLAPLARLEGDRP